MLAERGSSTSTERWLVVACSGLVFGLLAWASCYRLDPLDEGYFIYTSSRILAGELPYRDFSTPYTPGFFYLNALLFRLFGTDVLTLRLSLDAARVALYVLVYLLGRRIVPPAFAAIPVVMVFLSDQWPGTWESHPAWWAVLAFSGMVWCVCRHRETGKARWWLAACLCVSVSFVFKQTIGLFGIAALIGVAIADDAILPSLTLPKRLFPLAAVVARVPYEAVTVASPLYLSLIALIVGFGMRRHLDPSLLIVFVFPFGALALERLRAARSAGFDSDNSSRTLLVNTVIRLAALAVVFCSVTLAWLAPLAAALGPQNLPLALFVAAIETDGYFLEMASLRPELWPVLGLAVLVPLLVWLLVSSRGLIKKLWLILGGGLLGAGLVGSILRPAPEIHGRLARAGVLLTVHATTNFILYLPAAAFWGAYGFLLNEGRGSRVSFDLRWILFAGTLLLLNQYPRMDETHMLFSGPLIWIAGTYALWRVYQAATSAVGASWSGILGRASMYCALLALPMAALWPNIEIRRQDIFTRQPGAHLQFSTPSYVPLDLPGASVQELDFFAVKYQQIRAFIQENTQPGERIFVYPAAPLLYYLADRANATRFNHVLPGLLTSADELETIERLAFIPASYVIWDTFGADYWNPSGAYRTLTDFIWDNFEPVASFGGFEILRRKAA